MKQHDQSGEPEAGPADRPAKAFLLRTAAVLLTTAALCLTFLAPGAHAAATATSASVAVSATTIAAGASVGVTATLKKGTRAFPGATVSIQRRMTGTTTWSTVKTARTDAAGQIKATVTGNNYNYNYRTVYRGSAAARPSTSAVSTVRVRQVVGVSSRSTTSPEAGDFITMAGTTSAALKGKTASLQVLNEGAWQTVGTTTVTSLGTYSVRAKAALTGSRSYRVKVAGGTGVPSAVSATKKFNVYGWFYLNDLAPVATNYVRTLTGANVAGTGYPRAIGSTYILSSTYAEYNLSFRCTRFEATIGLSDASPSDFKAKMTSAVDGVVQDHGISGIGRKKSISVDTRNRFRLKIQADRMTGDFYGGGNAVWANPRVLCLSQP